MDTTFAQQIKAFRQRLGGKQSWMAQAVGCSVAAVSFWESGKRVPDPPALTRILEALNLAGVSEAELDGLRGSWREAKSGAGISVPPEPGDPAPALPSTDELAEEEEDNGHDAPPQPA